jgi:putative glycosyltransferase (TIGR04348 family)
MNIHIITPAGAGRRSGNRHTAQRWRDFLRDAGHRVTLAAQWDGSAADVLIALHARKSSAAVRQFHQACPDRPLILVLTGTDLYRDIKTHATAKRSLELASRLVVLQPAGVQELAPHLRAKTRVIYQSAATPLRQRSLRHGFRIAVVGHLRNEKDPFRAALALGHLPVLQNLELVQLGEALTPMMARTAKRYARAEPRYHWLGSKTHAETLRRMAASHLLVVSSVMEGGANVICEAARLGLPVLASRISGNVGMLGTDYPGYYPLRDDRALARLIARAAGDHAFYEKLKHAVRVRRSLFAPAAERRGVLRLLRDFD